MLHASFKLLVATSIILSANQVLAVELVELSDANLNLLNLEVGKALVAVQSALTNEFRFNQFEDARNFVIKCGFLEESMKDKSDVEFQGLAGKMKALLSDEQLQTLCHIDMKQFDTYSYLSEKEGGNFYLSNKRLSKLMAVGEKLEHDKEMKQILGHLYETKTRDTGMQLLAHAAEDTSIFFDEVHTSILLQTKYNTGCSVSSIKPICKLVRGVKSDDVSAYGADLAEFRQAIESNDQERINKRVQASGIQLDDLQTHCEAIQNSMHPIIMVQKYLEAGYLDEFEIVEQTKYSPDFYFYYELENLCKVQSQ